MASSAAQAYFNSQSPADQQAIRDSWGGADLMDEWYNNAVSAGAAGPQSQADPAANTGGQHVEGGGTTPYTGPADTTTWQTNVPMSHNTHPDAGKPSGDPFVDMIRNSSQGRSEDFGRFSNAQILAWKNSYVPGSNPPKFKNDFGDVMDKPTEAGPNAFAAGYSTGEKSGGGQIGGGGGGGGYGQGSGGAYRPKPAGYYDPDNPLQARLMELMQSGGGQMAGIAKGAFTKGGGAIWQTPAPGAAAPAAKPVPGAAPAATQGAVGAPAAPTGPGNAALTSAALNAFTPPEGMTTGAWGAPAGVTSALQGLTGGKSAATVPTAQPATQPAFSTMPTTPQSAQPVSDPNAWWKTPVV
jgi:hypothetical protein